ncbi:MAG: hypothetical protein IT320_06550 [Anaerolineae bacterium]|nr:hypothetical protein [Anaerolineae bacterium]
MFSELTKLLDRNFATGFVLPSAALLIITAYLLQSFGVITFPALLTGQTPLAETVLFGFLSWATGVVLNAVNLGVYRLLEGYGKKGNPFHYFLALELNRYRQLQKDVEAAREKAWNLKEGTPEREAAEDYWSRLQQKKAQEFPDAEEWILPTAFGNAIRAFEVYSRVMYGLEGIEGWPRLLSVIPADFRTELDTAQTKTNMWLNFWFISVLIILEYVVLVLVQKRVEVVGIIPVVIVFAVFAVQRATAAAISWGEFAKAAFDIYLPDLAAKLGYEVPKTRPEARIFWQTFTSAFIYRRPDYLDKLDRYIIKPKLQEPPRIIYVSSHPRLRGH